MQKFLSKFKLLLRSHKNLLLILSAGLLLIVIVFQVVFFNNRLPVFMEIDGQKFGAWNSRDVYEKLDNDYKRAKIEIFGDKAKKPFSEVSADRLGVVAVNQKRINDMSMPVWVRLVPSSPLWSHWIVGKIEPSFSIDKKKQAKFISETFGEKCEVTPVNPTLKVEGEKLVVKKGQDGGVCEKSEVEKIVTSVRPSIEKATRVDVPLKIISPQVQDEAADKLKQVIEGNLASDVIIQAGDKQVNLPAKTALSWLEFSAPEKEILVSISAEKSDKFFEESVAPLVIVAPGVSKVTTRDFVEVSRVNGAPGKALNFADTRISLADYLAGKADVAEAKTVDVAPLVEYTRSYSSTDSGMSAMLKHAAEDKSGRTGVAVIELSGKRRRASHNGDMQFTAASTYKMLLAFSVLKRVESGQLSWGDQVSGGRNLEKCFDDMIVISDNACPQELIKRIGHSAIQADMRELGLGGTNFLDREAYKTTANDLAQYSAMLESRQLPISRSSQDRLINAMRRNVYRQGIPAGASGAVADKVGFLDAFLNDAGIVYAPNGTYAVAIMTEKSSWANIADITRKIEAFRQN